MSITCFMPDGWTDGRRDIHEEIKNCQVGGRRRFREKLFLSLIFVEVFFFPGVKVLPRKSAGGDHELGFVCPTMIKDIRRREAKRGENIQMRDCFRLTSTLPNDHDPQ